MIFLRVSFCEEEKEETLHLFHVGTMQNPHEFRLKGDAK